MVVFAVSSVQALSFPAASAASCPSTANHDWVGAQWTTSSAIGVRAPVQMRKTGTVCTTQGSQEPDQDSDWIAIVSGSYIVQAGTIHLYNDALSASQYCRFWAIGTRTVHKYGCGTDSGGTYIYFRVHLVNAYYGYYYDVDDCGTGGGYSSCVTKNSSQQELSIPTGFALAETSYGGSNCTSRIMGSSSLPANMGTSSHAIEWQTAVAGSWGTKSLSGYSQSGCSQYAYVKTNSIVSTWDGRN